VTALPNGVTVVGSMNVDTTIRVAQHPRPGETVLGTSGPDAPGGKGANQAVAAAATGATTRLVAVVGNDPAGDAYRAALAEHGVDVTHVGRSASRPTGRAFITVSDDGENSIVVVAGANDDLNADHVRRALDAGSGVLLTQLESPPEVVASALRAARERGIRSVLNASPVLPEAAELARLADVVVVNEHERDEIGDLPDLCVTLGARGASWGGVTVQAPTVAVVDTTGAGDVFAGTLAGRLALGANREEALADAVRAGALATTTRGAQPWTLED